MKTVFLRVLEADVDDKAAALRAAIHAPEEAAGRTWFEEVLMNPSFEARSLAARKEPARSCRRTRNHLYTAFVERGIQLLYPGGMLGAITSRTGIFLSSFQKWREEILLEEAPPIMFADLGYGVLDGAMVEVAAYCLSKEVRA